MTNRLAKAVGKQFEKRLHALLPMFRTKKGERVPGGWSVFEFAVSQKLSLYIILAISSKRDAFTVEIGWSKTGKFPQYTSEIDSFSSGELAFRLSSLWVENRGDFWWQLRTEPAWPVFEVTDVKQDIEEKLAAVDVQVEDAVQRLVDHGVPYLEKVARDSGHPIKLR